MRSRSMLLVLLLAVALFSVLGTAKTTKTTTSKTTKSKTKTATCTKDRCLSAVQSNHRSGTSGMAGCTAFFRTTVIPATVSKTETTTTTTTVVLLGPTPETTTATRTLTNTTTFYETSTTVLTTTMSAKNKRAAVTAMKKLPVKIQARNAGAKDDGPITTSSTKVPAYATSVCADTSTYSSACSCVGAKHQTFTAPTPTTTTTITSHTDTTELLGSSTTTTTTTTVTTTDSTTSTATITSTSTVIDDGSPTRVLQNPTIIATPGTSSGSDLDDDRFNITVPFPVGIYGVNTTNLGVHCNGFTYVKGTPGDAFFEGPLPTYADGDMDGTQTLPDTAIAIYWSDLYYNHGTQQGLFYEIQGTTPRRTLAIEFYGTDRYNPQQYYHFVMGLPESRFDKITYTYYQVAGGGGDATVGAQSQTANMSTQFENRVSNSIYPGLSLAFNSTTNTFRA